MCACVVCMCGVHVCACVVCMCGVLCVFMCACVLCVFMCADGGRLRFDDDNNGLGPPLYENQTLSDAGLVQGQRVIMEPGPAPQQSEVRAGFCIFLSSRLTKTAPLEHTVVVICALMI